MDNIFAELAAWLGSLAVTVLSALSPLISGLILAYLLNPAVDWLGPRLGRGWAIVITYITLGLLRACLLYTSRCV